jgi:hypothetical protein
MARGKDRRREDSRIILGVAKLSLPKRWKRLQDLTKKLEQAEAALALNSNAAGVRNEATERAMRAEEKRVADLKLRLQLEKSEYQNLRTITPDYKEPHEMTDDEHDAQ